MSKSLPVFFCHVCGQIITEENIHKLNCRQISFNINKKPFPHTQKISKSNNNYLNYSPLNNQNQNYYVGNGNQVSINLDLINDPINSSPEEKLTEDGINNAKNLNSNFNLDFEITINQNFTNSNIQNNNSVFISESYDAVNRLDKTILDNLNVVIINGNEAFFQSDNICIICREHYHLGDRYIILPCVHNYHERCIKTWFERNNKCPICNHVLTPNEFPEILFDDI